MVTYTNIKKSYNNKLVLDIKELSFECGNIYGIKGANGSGKSTLCKILSKVDMPDDKIIYPNIKIGYMPQHSYVFDMSVKNNMMINFPIDEKIYDSKNIIIDGDKINYISDNRKIETVNSKDTNIENTCNIYEKKIDDCIMNSENNTETTFETKNKTNFSNTNSENIDEINRIISDKELIICDLLKQFDLEKYIDKNAKKLSGGEKQKLCLARLLLHKWDMLILDEPTSSMDYESTIMTEEIIKKYVIENNNIVLMVSHEEGEIERMTKNIIYLEKGKIRY